jgi:hypothetical protein
MEKINLSKGVGKEETLHRGNEGRNILDTIIRRKTD